MKSGIYTIRNIINNKYYVGCSKDMVDRIGAHKRALIKGTHKNILLQNSFNKYGILNFVFSFVFSYTSN